MFVVFSNTYRERIFAKTPVLTIPIRLVIHNHLKQLGALSSEMYQNPNTQAMPTELYETCNDLSLT